VKVKNHTTSIHSGSERRLEDAVAYRQSMAGKDYDRRGFTCRDLEGHIWNFGTYDPW